MTRAADGYHNNGKTFNSLARVSEFARQIPSIQQVIVFPYLNQTPDITGVPGAVLNPGGVRIGTAEIYRQVEKLDEIVDSVCVGQAWEKDVRVLLFVVLRTGIDLTNKLKQRIQKIIRENATPRSSEDRRRARYSENAVRENRRDCRS